MGGGRDGDDGGDGDIGSGAWHSRPTLSLL